MRQIKTLTNFCIVNLKFNNLIIYLSFLFLSFCGSNKSNRCSNNEDCNESSNVCTKNICINNKCVEEVEEDFTECSKDANVCYKGSCIKIYGNCSNDQDCVLSYNPCLKGTCLDVGLCAYEKENKLKSCGEHAYCIDGYCSNKCLSNTNCTSSFCTQSTCDTSDSIFTNPGGLTNTRSLFWLDSYWYLRTSDSLINKLGSDFSFIKSYDTSSITYSNNTQIFSDGTNWYIPDKYNGIALIKVHDLNFKFIKYISISIPNYSINEIYSVYYLKGHWFATLFVSGSHTALAKFDKDFNFIKYEIGDFGTISVKDNYFYIRGKGLASTITKYNLDLESENVVYDFSEYKSLKEIQILSIFSHFYKGNAWYIVLSNEIVKLNSDFSVNTYCKPSYAPKDTYISDLGCYCNEGFCAPCSNNTHCDDNIICTSDNCFFGACKNSVLANQTPCGEGKYCLNSVCLGGCISNDECDPSTFCRNYFCNLTTQTCNFTNINENQYCEVENRPEKTHICSSGVCSYDTRFCKGYPYINTGTILGTIILNSAYDLGNNQEAYFYCSLYKRDESLFCGGFKASGPLLGHNYNSILMSLGDDNTTQIKDGFSGGEFITFLVRTNDYVCRFKGVYHIESGYVNNDNWYPTSISLMLHKRDYTNKNFSYLDWKLDFNDSNNCCHFEDFECIDDIGKNDSELLKTCYNLGEQRNNCYYVNFQGIDYSCVCSLKDGKLKWRIPYNQRCKNTTNKNAYCDQNYACTQDGSYYYCR